MPAAELAAAATFWLAQFLTALARLSFIVFFMPGLTEQVVPMRLRVFALIALSTIIAVSGVIVLPPVKGTSGLLSLVAAELAVGFALGVLIRMSGWILSMTGAVIAQAIGLSQMLGVSLEGESETVVATLLQLMGTVLLVSTNFHLAVVEGVLRTYTDIPPGAFLQLDLSAWPGQFYAAFKFAMLLAWPFVVINLLYNVCLGYINKALPQLMVAFVGAPFMIGAGLVLLAVSLTGLMMMWLERVVQIAVWL